MAPKVYLISEKQCLHLKDIRGHKLLYLTINKAQQNILLIAPAHREVKIVRPAQISKSIEL